MSFIKDQVIWKSSLRYLVIFQMPRPLKKSTKRNGIIKLNKKVRNFKDKAGHVLINSFLLPLLPPHQSYQGIICTNMNNSCIPIFCSSCNGFYDQNILHCRLLGLMINSTSLNFFLITCDTVDVFKSLTN